MRSIPPPFAALVPILLLGPLAAAGKVSVADDVAFALDELEKRCGLFFQQKEIDWDSVREEFTAEAAKTKSESDEGYLLTRLLARLRDGHASVVAGSMTVKWPAKRGPFLSGVGISLYADGQTIRVRSAFGAAEKAKVEPGSAVRRVNDVDVHEFLDARRAEIEDVASFSTKQHATAYLMTYGLSGKASDTLALDLETVTGKSRRVALRCSDDAPVPRGPIAAPKQLAPVKDGLSACRIADGRIGYVALPRVLDDLPERIDATLAALKNPDGIILDFRGNVGGGCDHDAVLGEFVPSGKTMERAHAYPIASHGAHPYGGPVVVLVDGLVASAGETASGMFKEDGRGYVLGESATAGMSGVKETVALPSGRFSLYVTVQSNKARFQGGRGIEGVGIEPHEVVPLDPESLAAGEDPLILRAVEVLNAFPQEQVPYDPAAFGWTKGA